MVREVKRDTLGITTPTSVKYEVNVNVTDNGDGKLNVVSQDNYEKLDFVNEYEAKGSITFKGTKSIDVRELNANDVFEFSVYKVVPKKDAEGKVIDGEFEEELVETVTNNVTDGAIAYPTINYVFNKTKDERGDYKYVVREVKRDTLGITTPTSVEYEVNVNVTDNGDGKLNVVSQDNYEKLDFVNTYKATGSVKLFAQKDMVNRTPKEREFKFSLYKVVGRNADNTYKLEEVETNVPNGSNNLAEFSEIVYHEDEMQDAEYDVDDKGNIISRTKQIMYVIKEVKPAGTEEDPIDPTVIYDDDVEEITVTLKDDLQGKIEATTNPTSATVAFTNIVIKAKKIDISDQHELEGAVIQVIDKETNKVVFEYTSTRDENGTEIENLEIDKVYILRETVAPNGYKLTTDTEFSVAADGTITSSGDNLATDKESGVTYLLIEDEMITVQAAVKKVWKDDENRDASRPLQLQVNLLANGVPCLDKDGKAISVTLDPSNGWTAMVKGLPMVDLEQKDIEYTWKEENPGDGYTLSGSVKEGILTTLTNTYTSEKTSVSVKKVWEDKNNAAGVRPTSITVQLSANGKAIDTQVLNEANGWSYTWSNLAKNYNPNGEMGMTSKPVVYKVEELDVPEGYTMEVSGTETSFTITNTLVPGKLEIQKTFNFVPVTPEEPDDTPVDIPVIKSWDDNGNKDGNRPESVKVHLLADGVEVASAELNEANEWKYTFTEMPRLNGEEQIVYTITEDPVKWYEAQINGYNVLNVYKPELTEATVSKVWNDGENELGLRPSTIYMRLSNGTVVLLSESNGWTATVRDLPAYVNGEAVTYTWTEQEAPGYEQVDRMINGNTTVFVNRLMVVPEIPTEQVQPTVPGGGWVIFDEYETALGGETLINHVGDCFD